MKKAVLFVGTLCLLAIGILFAYYKAHPKRELPIPQKPPDFIVGAYQWGYWYMGASLHLEEDGTYSLSWHSDVQKAPGEEEREDEGVFVVEGKKVTLTSLKRKKLVKTYYAVAWDRRIYLLEDTQFPYFVHAIQSGEEPYIPGRKKIKQEGNDFSFVTSRRTTFQRGCQSFLNSGNPS